ncbi:hypothetical protein [Streptomyces lavendulae]|uniref:hypothetical protein n=1 Tax=Streptomyces lavendulae TaxID=1914 RepID=UPI0033E69160
MYRGPASWFDTTAIRAVGIAGITMGGSRACHCRVGMSRSNDYGTSNASARALDPQLDRQLGTSSDIDFTFARQLTVRTTIGALAATGWALEEPLSYMVNDDDLYEWQSTTRDRTQDVLAVLDEPEHANHHVAVCIYHGEASTGGQLLFFPGHMTCSVTPTINRRYLPDLVDFTDLSWYMRTLVPPLLTVGLRAAKRSTSATDAACSISPRSMQSLC